MSKKITIKDAASPQNSITIEPVKYSYESTLDMRIDKVERFGGYGFNDYSDTYDSRRCTASWFLPPSEANDFINTFKTRTKSRGKSVEIILDTGSGFFIFGPDKGDASTSGDPFQARLIDIRPKGIQHSPYKYFLIEADFEAESFPSYSPPAQSHPDTDEGSLQIGTISGLRIPDDFFDPSYTLNTVNSRALDGTVYTIDKFLSGDLQKTVFNMKCNLENAAALLEHIQGTVRAADVTIQPPSGSYIFGRAGGDLSSYTARLLNNKIFITNTMYNRFDFSLEFIRV